jgi:hypothetical protein
LTSTDVTWWVMSSTITVVAFISMAAMVWAGFAMTRVPQGPVAVPRRDGTWVPLGAPGAPPSRWHAHFPRPSGAPLLGEVGMLELTNGELAYTPEGAAAPAWHYPAYAIRAQHHTRPFFPATVDLWLPTDQLLHLEVSRNPIRHWLRSNITNITRPKEAHVFLQLLGANGALVSPTARWQFPPGGRILR